MSLGIMEAPRGKLFKTLPNASLCLYFSGYNKWVTVCIGSSLLEICEQLYRDNKPTGAMSQQRLAVESRFV